MSLVYVCDRCGLVREKMDRLSYQRSREMHTVNSADLCDTCMVLVLEFINEKTFKPPTPTPKEDK